METYHKIKTVFKRNPDDNYRTLLEDRYALPEFEYLKDNLWVFTEKIHGTNIRVIWDGDEVLFGGKTDRAQIPTFLRIKLKSKFPLLLFEEHYCGQMMCLYGEGYGAKIQKGGGNYLASGVDFILFDVRINEWWLQREDVEEIAGILGTDVVPVVGEGTLRDGVEMVRAGLQSIFGDFEAEGIVMKPKMGLSDRGGRRVITKIKGKDFPK